MGKHKNHDKMYTPFDTKDVLDELVGKICEKHGLLEATVRDMLRGGWMYQETKWVKQGQVVQLNS